MRYLTARAQTRQEKTTQIFKNFECEEGIKLSKMELYILMNFCLTLTFALSVKHEIDRGKDTHRETESYTL